MCELVVVVERLLLVRTRVFPVVLHPIYVHGPDDVPEIDCYFLMPFLLLVVSAAVSALCLAK